MKKIGFIDYYISEWHANNYPVWIKQICEEKGLDYQVCYAWAEDNISQYDGRDTDTWCKEFGVEKCDSIAELCEKSDYVIILAPSNPEKHLGYVEEAFKCGKRTYVDKTFAPDYATAKKIFEIAEKYNTPFFSTSALRYGEDVKDFIGVDNLSVTGGGSNLPEYIIHQVEMLVKTLGMGAKKVMLTKNGEEDLISVAYDDNRNAQLHYQKGYKYGLATKAANGEEKAASISGSFFLVLIEKILHFFETGDIDFDVAQTLEVMKVREAIIKAEAAPDTWINV